MRRIHFIPQLQNHKPKKRTSNCYPTAHSLGYLPHLLLFLHFFPFSLSSSLPSSSPLLLCSPFLLSHPAFASFISLLSLPSLLLFPPPPPALSLPALLYPPPLPSRSPTSFLLISSPAPPHSASNHFYPISEEGPVNADKGIARTSQGKEGSLATTAVDVRSA